MLAGGLLVAVVALVAVAAVVDVPDPVPPEDPQPAPASAVPASTTIAARRAAPALPRSRTR
jgi:hypothetical protein